MEDEQLILILDKNPNQGWEILITQYSGLLYHIVGGILDNAEDREDAVSIAFTDAFEKWQEFDLRKGSIKSFLAIIAVRRGIDLKRRKKQELEFDDEISRSEFGVLDELIKKESKERVLDFLFEMKEPDRSMVIDRYFFGRKSKEMALIYQITSNTIDQKISRALKSMRVKMEVEI